MERVGFIGLGTIGLPMATQILAAGFPLLRKDVASVRSLAGALSVDLGLLGTAADEATGDPPE